MNLKIAIVQMEIIDGNKESNINNALNALTRLAQSKDRPDIVVFPELFTTGYDLMNVQDHAEAIPGETIESISRISMGKFITIGTILERFNEKFFNTAFILGKEGDLMGRYRKTHLFAPMNEKDFLSPGDEINVFNIAELNDLKIGIAICYDLRFPEVFRIMALRGAQIVFLPSEFPKPRKEIWKTLLHARAIENQLFMIGVNRVGKGRDNNFFGNSLVTNGNYLESMGESAEIKIFKINLNSLEPIRNQIPALKDRRDDLYNL